MAAMVGPCCHVGLWAFEQVFGRKLLSSLTDAFGVMVFEEGFFHADPHPGNIFIRPTVASEKVKFSTIQGGFYCFLRTLPSGKLT